MRKSVIGAATLALLASTALVSAQQERNEASPPAAKEQGAQSAPDKGGERGDAGRAKSDGKASDAREKGEKGKSTARDSKSEPAQERKGSAQKQTDQGKERTAEPKDKAGSDKGKAAETKDRAGDRKQDTARDGDQRGKQDTARDRDDRGKQGDQARDGKDGDRDRDQARGKDDRRDGDRVNLSQDQRKNVREKLGRNREARHTNVNFSINIGTRVPRDFRLVVVPTDIVAIVPAYRGYRYFIVEERVVIVHPTRYEIVEVIEVDSGPRRGGPVTASIELSQPQIALILDRVPMDRHRADVRIDLALGAEVPSSVELYEFPAEVVAEIPVLRSHRYVVVDRRVVIVDPSGRDVIRVIDR